MESPLTFDELFGKRALRSTDFSRVFSFKAKDPTRVGNLNTTRLAAVNP